MLDIRDRIKVYGCFVLFLAAGLSGLTIAFGLQYEASGLHGIAVGLAIFLGVW